MPRPPGMALVVTFLEAGTICRLVEHLLVHLPDAHILIVDDQSPDGTADLVRRAYRGEARVEVVCRTGRRGYGAAMREGFARFLAANAAWLVTIDADFSHDPAIAPRMVERLNRNGGLVIGSRYLDGSRSAGWNPTRMLLSSLGNRYVRWITGLPVADCTSGFRCYSRTAVVCAEPPRLNSRGYAFLIETLYAVWLAGLPIAEVPIMYRDRLVGESKLDARTMVESLVVPWRIVRAGRRRADRDVAPTPP